MNVIFLAYREWAIEAYKAVKKNPEISNYNIIRVCATSSPGEGSDNFWNVKEKAKWRQVGYCGNENLGCWLDTESIEDSFNWDSTLDDSLVEVNEYYNAVLADQSITDEEFEAFENPECNCSFYPSYYRNLPPELSWPLWSCFQVDLS